MDQEVGEVKESDAEILDRGRALADGKWRALCGLGDLGSHQRDRAAVTALVLEASYLREHLRSERGPYEKFLYPIVRAIVPNLSAWERGAAVRWGEPRTGEYILLSSGAVGSQGGDPLLLGMSGSDWLACQMGEVSGSLHRAIDTATSTCRGLTLHYFRTGDEPGTFTACLTVEG